MDSARDSSTDIVTIAHRLPNLDYSFVKIVVAPREGRQITDHRYRASGGLDALRGLWGRLFQRDQGFVLCKPLIEILERGVQASGEGKTASAAKVLLEITSAALVTSASNELQLLRDWRTLGRILPVDSTPP